MVADAVENQMMVTRTIDTTASDVAGESSSIATSSRRWPLGARTTQGAGQIDAAAAELAQMAVRLQTLVSKFRFEGDDPRGGRAHRRRLPAELAGGETGASRNARDAARASETLSLRQRRQQRGAQRVPARLLGDLLAAGVVAHVEHVDRRGWPRWRSSSGGCPAPARTACG